MYRYTSDDYQRLLKAIAGGYKDVAYADRRVSYRSLGEMMKIKEQMEEQLGIRKKVHRILTVTSTGVRS